MKGGPRLMRSGEMGLSLCTAIDVDDYNKIFLISSLQRQHLYLIPSIYTEKTQYTRAMLQCAERDSKLI